MPRISSIQGIGQCPGFAVIRSVEDGSRAPAETGQAVGRIIELYHKAGEHAGALEEAMRVTLAEAPEKFPQADLDAARTMALGYCADPRNRGVVVPDSCELEVRLTLPPAPEDPTGQPVELQGHVDQLRRGPNGVLRVWDTKSGKPGGIELLYSAAWQLAAYALAATETLGQTVLPGGVIRLRAYDGGPRAKPPAEANAHFEAPWSLDQCRTMLATAVQEIAWLRAGLIHLRPGLHCMYCPAGGPHVCGERIDRIPELPKGLTA